MQMVRRVIAVQAGVSGALWLLLLSGCYGAPVDYFYITRGVLNLIMITSICH